MKGTYKRFLSMLLALVMVLTLIPATALAAGNDPDVVYGTYGENGDWVQGAGDGDGTYTDPETGVTVSKIATPTEDPNTFTITLTVETSTTTTVTNPDSAATVLVIDLSNSMKLCADCGEENTHTSECQYSGSVQTSQNRLTAAINAAKAFLESYAGDNEAANRQLAVVGFGTSARTFLTWVNVAGGAGKNSYDEAVTAIDSLAIGFTNPDPNPAPTYTVYKDSGGTNLQAGLQLAANLAGMDAVSGTTKNVIALTDGVPTYQLPSSADTTSTSYLGIKKTTKTQQQGQDSHDNHGGQGGQGGQGGSTITTYMWDEDIAGSGSAGSKENNDAATTAANNIKTKNASVYTVCFGVADNECYNGGPTVGSFLSGSVATPAETGEDDEIIKQYAYDADDTDELNDAFKAITSSITEGLTGEGVTATDPMADGVTAVLPEDAAGVTETDEGFQWDLSRVTPTTRVQDNTTYYTYTLTYTVTLDPTTIEGFDEDAYYPLNGETTLTIPGQPPIDFPVPGVKGVLPTYTVTYQPGDHGTLAGADRETGNVVHENVKHGTATPTPPAVTPAEGYYFSGWDPEVAKTVTADVTYTAQYQVQTAVTVTGGSDTVTYNGTEQSVSGFTAAGLPEGYTLSGLNYSASGTDAGSYSGSFTGAAVIRNSDGQDVTKQFKITTEAGTLVINPKAVTVQADDKEKFYGEADPELTATVTGLVASDSEDLIAYNLEREAGEDVGEYTITPTGDATQGNYTVTYEPGTLTIVKADRPESATVTATPYNDTYDGDAHGITVSGATLEGDTVYYSTTNDGTDWTTEAPTRINVQDAETIYVKVTNPNYYDATANATITITKRAVTITVNDAEKFFGENDPDFTGSITLTDGSAGKALVNDDDLGTISYVRIKGDSGDEGVGDYDNVLTATYTENNNYAVTVVPGDFSIRTAPIPNGAAVIASGGSKVYDGTALTASAELTEQAAGYTVYYKVGGGAWTTEAPSVTDVDDGTKTVSVKAVKAGYEDLTGNTVTIAITPRKVTLTSEGETWTYDGAAHSNEVVKADGFVGADGATYSNFATITNVIESPKDNTFTYTLWDGTVEGQKETKAANYEIETVFGILTVTKNDGTGVVLTATGYEGTYDGAAHDGVTAAAVTGAVEDNAWTYTYSIDGTQYSATIPQYTDAGTYTVYVKASNDNYEDLTTTAKVIIHKAPLTVTTPDAEKTYDGTALTAAGEMSGLVNGETATFTTTGTQTAAGSSRNTYSLTWDGSAKQSNYELSSETIGTLTVNPAVVTIVVENKSKTYGEADPVFTGTVEGVITGEDLNVKYVRAAGEEDVEDVGSVTITATYDPNSNYVVTVTDGTLTINPKAVTVTAKDAGKTYGAADPALTATVEGLLAGESADLIRYTVTRAAGEDVGEYTITPAGDAVQDNYAVTYVPGNFTITKASVTIVVDNKTKSYGTSDPAFTGTILGVAKGDDLNVAYARAAGDVGKENAGDDITITASYDANSNYDVTVTPGKLTIIAATDNAVNLEAYAGKYDGGAHSIQAAAVKEGSTLYYSIDGETWSETLPTFTDAGVYTVSVYATNPNYADTAVASATVTITKRQVTLTSATDSKVYDGTPLTNASVAAGGDGFVEGEGAAYTVTGLQTKIGSSKNTFTYRLNDGTKAGNYDITQVEGTLTVTAATNVTVTKTPEKATVIFGGTIIWNVRVKNSGDADAKDLILTDSIPGVTITAPEGVDYRCFDLKAGESVTFTVAYKPAGIGTYINHVEVSQPKDSPDNPGATEKIAEDDSEKVIVVSGDYPSFSAPEVPVLIEDHVAYIIGYEDGTVRPENTITRAEVATIFFRLLTNESRAKFWSVTNRFADVDADAWYNNAVSTLDAAGIIVDSENGLFRPNDPITRAELAVMAAQFTGLTTQKSNSFSDVPDDYWAAMEITLVERLGWIEGYEDGTFRPDNTITRAEAMAIINRMQERAVEAHAMLPNMVTWTDNPESAWYYEVVQEATNTHTYIRNAVQVPGRNYCYENWQTILPNPDWAALEKSWSNANSK